VPTRKPGPIQLESSLVPVLNCLWLDQNQSQFPFRPDAPQQNPEEPIRCLKTRCGLLGRQYRKLLAQRQILKGKLVAGAELTGEKRAKPLQRAEHTSFAAERDYVESSGNAFADLNLPNADELLAKVELALQITTMIRQRHMTQMQAAEVLDVDQPKVSALMCGRLAGFSIERWLRFLLSLGADVAITIKPHGRTLARTRSNTGEARRSRRELVRCV